MFLILIFALVFLLYIGLEVGYKNFLRVSIEEADLRISEFSQSPDLAEHKNLVSFYSQITNLEKVLNSHVWSSNVLKFLEDYTTPKTAYSTVEVAVPERRLTIDGVTSSYASLVEQLVAYESAPQVAGVVMEENSLLGNVVRFRVNINLSPDVFKEILN